MRSPALSWLERELSSCADLSCVSLRSATGCSLRGGSGDEATRQRLRLLVLRHCVEARQQLQQRGGEAASVDAVEWAPKMTSFSSDSPRPAKGPQHAAGCLQQRLQRATGSLQLVMASMQSIVQRIRPVRASAATSRVK